MTSKRPTYVKLAGVTSLVAGREHYCALVADRTVSCWGSNGSGQLAASPRELTESRDPRPIAGLSGVVQIVAGRHHSCARDQQGVVRCWGADAAGQLGQLPRSLSLVPVGIGPSE